MRVTTRLGLVVLSATSVIVRLSNGPDDVAPLKTNSMLRGRGDVATTLDVPKRLTVSS
jgi:hypothetical protein